MAWCLVKHRDNFTFTFTFKKAIYKVTYSVTEGKAVLHRAYLFRWNYIPGVLHEGMRSLLTAIRSYTNIVTFQQGDYCQDCHWYMGNGETIQGHKLQLLDKDTGVVVKQVINLATFVTFQS